MLDDLNRDVASSGGGWFKLNRIEHGTLKGIVVDVETREKTFKGSVVLSRKTGKPRQERVFTLITDQRDPEVGGLIGTLTIDQARRLVRIANSARLTFSDDGSPRLIVAA